MDTETLLAIVETLLDVTQSKEAIMEALIEHDGDPEAAARYLTRKSRPTEKKRPRADLTGWLKPSSAKKLKPSISDPQLETTPVASTSRARLPEGETKPVVDLMTILKQPPKPEKTAPKLPPLMLSTPEHVAEHTPCTLHPSILPPELACRLFYAMVDLSRRWNRNKWWLFDRIVESPHRTSFFARAVAAVDGSAADQADNAQWQESARAWYNGRIAETPALFPPEMEEACTIIERVVNEEIKKRIRFPLEWDGGSGDDPAWRANVAASNCYEGGKESVGFHSDQLTCLGPYPTIASLSLGTRRVFSLREVIPSDEAKSRRARTFNVPLPHNSLTIMHASCQERFKHSIPPQPALDMYRPAFPRMPGGDIESSNCRINITFRFYRPDFLPASVPRCKCNVPTILRPDMKNRVDGKTDRYWWTCYAGAQNEGKGCNLWQTMDMKKEGRGPVVADRLSAL
ncbi:GRF zinc finger family protein [Favolaschia claudopus]|uniref:GRF zinc finger family protein n=1 Tax=Favolaschia claudopus TaxID=2862362 RepID=A0AAW0BCU6_9AGAR